MKRIRPEKPLPIANCRLPIGLKSEIGNRRSAILLLALALSVGAAGAEDRNLAPTPRLDPAGENVRRWAVIIGISDYKDPKIKDLKYADADAKALCDFLRTPQGGSFPAERVRLLVNEEATVRAVRSALADFLKQAQVDDVVIIFFAGHGAPEPGRADTAYLLCYDTDPKSLYSTALPMDEVRNILQKRIYSRRVLVIADACHAGSIGTAGIRSAEEAAIAGRLLLALKESKHGRAILMSCAEGELSQEDAKWGGGHGVFTHCLLEGLKGHADTNHDQIVDLQELFDYTRPKVADKTSNDQHPELSGGYNLPLAVAAAPAAAAQPEGSTAPRATVKWITGSLRLGADLAGATVILDDRDEVLITRAGGLATISDVLEGRHGIRVLIGNHELFKTTVEVTRDKAAEVIVDTGWAKVERRKAQVFTEVGTEWREINHYTNALGMEFVLIPAGEFSMGDTLSPEEADKRWPGGNVEWYQDTHPRHAVTLTKPFYLGKCEVTRGQFARFVADSGYKTDAEKAGKAYGHKAGRWGYQKGYSWKNPGFPQTDQHPATGVSWNDAKAFCGWLSAKTGRTYGLPTEAQWEYACRAGAECIWPWGDDEKGAQGNANVAGEDEDVKWTDKFTGVRDGYTFTAPGGSFAPNAFGLHDMIGNVAELCADWYGDGCYANAPPSDPTGPGEGRDRILRGGSSRGHPRDCRCAYRSWIEPWFADSLVGFRVTRTLK